MSTTPDSTEVQHRGIIAWFAHNHVAGNLLMLVILAIGGYSALNMQRAIMPEFDIDRIEIIMAYPGASPVEVEQGLVLKIEEVVKDIEAVERVDSTASDSMARVNLKIIEGYDVLATLDEVKSAIDAVVSFPEEAEKPVIRRTQFRKQALNIQVYGDSLDERGMKELTEQIKEELLQNPDIGAAEIQGARPYEIAIELSEAQLRKYNLSLDQVAQAVRNNSLDMPGGAIKTENGEIMLRAKGQAYSQHDFENIVLITHADGTRLTLGDIGTISDGFVEAKFFSNFDHKPSMAITVSAVGEQDIIQVAKATKDYIAKKRETLPPGISIDSWADSTYYLEGRLSMMLKNMAFGALLVFVVLGLFLDIKLAFWVMAGLPVCFLGAFALMPIDGIGATVNMISLFGFILVLGIVVDDAIIIGESAHTVTEEKGHSVNSIIEGAMRVATPATFGVLTTIVAFTPTLFVEGAFAAFPKALGSVVILCLVFSLVESKWILPAHLAYSTPSNHGLWGVINKVQEFCNKHLYRFISVYYQPLVRTCIQNRYTTIATFLAALIITGGLVAGGVARFVMLPDMPGDFIKAELEMIEGSSQQLTKDAHQRIELALRELNEEVAAETGEGFIGHVFSFGFNDRFASFMLELTKSEARQITSSEILTSWREKVGDIPGAKVMSISDSMGMGGPAIGFKLLATDLDVLAQASRELEMKLANYAGVYDIRNSNSSARSEITLSMKPGGQALGLSLAQMGSQVRQAFYGAEAQRIQRGLDEVKVMVRYPEHERKSIANLEDMYIRTGAGDEVPFDAVANIDISPSNAKTTRIDGQRAVTISAQVHKDTTQPGDVVSNIRKTFIPDLLQRYPGINFKMDGESDESEKMMVSLFLGFSLALFGIYALLAIPLKSYSQPLIVMGVIPFGIIGAIIGHMVVGISIGMWSVFGIIALSGVVVNDSLIMVDFVNKAVDKGVGKYDAIMQAGTSRFRAILLTSLTTFFGLLPMLLETSLQAQQIVPMAVSLGFGIVFATLITLLLVPCLYMALEDILGERQTEPEPSDRGVVSY